MKPSLPLAPDRAHARHDEVFSKNSFASFTFVARYGLPPRSGWLSSISVRWAFRTFSLVTARSLWEPVSPFLFAPVESVAFWSNQGTHFRERIRVASFLFMRGSKPPL